MANKPLKTIRFPNSEQVYEITDEVARSGIQSLNEKVNKKPDVYSGTTEPDNSLGKDGDIYVKFE